MSDQVFKAAEGAVWGMLISDALSMPVHWYYNPSDIKRGYGSWLTGYVAPNQKHPSSILSLSAVGKYDLISHSIICFCSLNSVYTCNDEWQ